VELIPQIRRHLEVLLLHRHRQPVEESLPLHEHAPVPGKPLRNASTVGGVGPMQPQKTIHRLVEDLITVRTPGSSMQDEITLSRAAAGTGDTDSPAGAVPPGTPRMVGYCLCP
jgi:hypothetical protein